MEQPSKQELEGYARENFEALLDRGVTWATWLSAGDGRCCEHCEEKDNTVVRIADVKVPWHEGCTNEVCRCVLVAAPGPDDE